MDNTIQELESKLLEKNPTIGDSHTFHCKKLEKIIDKIEETLTTLYGDQIQPLFEQLKQNDTIDLSIEEIKEFMNNYEGRFFSELKKKNYFTLSNKNLINLDETLSAHFPMELTSFATKENKLTTEKLIFQNEDHRILDLENQICKLKENISVLENENHENERQFTSKIKKLEDQILEFEKQKLRAKINSSSISDAEALKSAQDQIESYKETIEEFQKDNMALSVQVENLLHELDEKNSQIDLQKTKRNDLAMVKTPSVKLFNQKTRYSDMSGSKSPNRLLKTGPMNASQNQKSQDLKAPDQRDEEINSLKNQVENLTEEMQKLEELKESFEDLKAENSMLNKKLDGVKGDLKTSQNERKIYFEQLQKERSEFENTKNTFDSSLTASQKLNDQLNKEVSNLNAKVDQLIKKLSDSEKNLLKNAKLAQHDDEQSQRFKADIEKHKKMILQLNSNIDLKSIEIETLKSEIEKLQRYISSLL